MSIHATPEFAPDETLANHGDEQPHVQGPARRRLVWSMLVTTIMLFACYMSAGTVLLPAQVAAFDPAAKEANLAVVTSLSSFFTLFAQPIVGAFSDRTRHRLGRRAPWMLGGAFLGCIMLILIPIIGRNVALIAITWVLAQVSLNALQGPLSAIVSDRLDPNYRGTASAFFGVGSTIGMALGVVVGGRLVTHLGLGYAIFAVLVMIVTVVMIVLNQDGSSKDLVVSRFSVGEFIKGFWISPRQHPDFAWAFAQRFVMFLGYMSIFGYMFYILLSYLHLDTVSAGALMGVQSLVGAVASVLATFVAGPLSDRLGSRKLFVVIASGMVAAGCLVPLLLPTITGVVIYAAVAGAGFGCYLAVDVALVVDVLPHPEDAARDLGVINIANNVPQLLAPIVNALLIAAFGYSSLWIWAIVLVIVASICVLPIKGVR